MAEAFPHDEPIAVWVMNLSISLGDLRIVAKFLARAEQPKHERIYFVRLFASHLREICKLLVLDYEQRQDVRQFVASLPQEAREARECAELLLCAGFPSRSDIEIWRDLKRLRDDTFHYARDAASQDRLVAAMRTVSEMKNGQLESTYTIGDNHMRADYADLVVANRMHPFPEEHEDDTDLLITRELHEAVLDLNGHVANFIAAVEGHYLLHVLDTDAVKRETVASD